MDNSACEMHSSACEMHSSACEMHSSACGMHSSACEMHSSACEMHSSACEIHGSAPVIQDRYSFLIVVQTLWEGSLSACGSVEFCPRLISHFDGSRICKIQALNIIQGSEVSKAALRELDSSFEKQFFFSNRRAVAGELLYHTHFLRLNFAGIIKSLLSPNLSDIHLLSVHHDDIQTFENNNSPPRAAWPSQGLGSSLGSSLPGEN